MLFPVPYVQLSHLSTESVPAASMTRLMRSRSHSSSSVGSGESSRSRSHASTHGEGSAGTPEGIDLQAAPQTMEVSC